MRNDNNGCSTTVAGKENYETFKQRMGRKIMHFVQYDYRHPSGALFTCVKNTLEACREARDKWVAAFEALPPDELAHYEEAGLV